MLFNSFEFAVYIPIVFTLYWLLKDNLKAQNVQLVIASYVFYGWWDWRFLALIVFSSALDFMIGLGLARTYEQKKRKLLLGLSIFVNLGFLGFFKYCNFFIDSFADVFTLYGTSFNYTSLQIILPVGISFYTFQTLSYSIDVYRNKLDATRDPIAFFAFVSFFPQLVAGPIERATNLLPQFYRKRNFEYEQASDGMRQILWGLFKKIVIADNCAPIVNDIFANYGDYSGGVLLLGAVLFAFQIYGDFSGYSDIAIGTARLFGIKLMQNFAFPYFSRDIGEFWRRWHISLSTWFRDYVYIPLGGSRGGTWMKVRNTFIIFLVSGFWHGANWTFIAWGFLNALYFLPLLLLNQNRTNLDTVAENTWFPSVKEFFQIGLTFFITSIAWIFFRAKSIGQAFEYIYQMLQTLVNGTFLEELSSFILGQIGVAVVVMLVIFLIVEWLQRKRQHGLEFFRAESSVFFRWGAYLSVYFMIVLFGSFEQSEFIYFQF